MKIKRMETEDGITSVILCDECGCDAQLQFHADDDSVSYLCMNCFLSTHDRDRIQWYRRIWTLKSMLEQEERKKKPKPPKWGIRGLLEK